VEARYHVVTPSQNKVTTEDTGLNHYLEHDILYLSLALYLFIALSKQLGKFIYT